MNELIRNIVDNQFEKIIKKIDSLEYKIDILQKNIISIDKKIDVYLETVNTSATSTTSTTSTTSNTSTNNPIK